MHSHSSLWCRVSEVVSCWAGPLVWHVGQHAVCPFCLQVGQESTSWQQDSVVQSLYWSHGQLQYLQSERRHRVVKTSAWIVAMLPAFSHTDLRWRRRSTRWRSVRQTQKAFLDRNPLGNVPGTCESHLSAGKSLCTHSGSKAEDSQYVDEKWHCRALKGQRLQLNTSSFWPKVRSFAYFGVEVRWATLTADPSCAVHEHLLVSEHFKVLVHVVWEIAELTDVRGQTLIKLSLMGKENALINQCWCHNLPTSISTFLFYWNIKSLWIWQLMFVIAIFHFDFLIKELLIPAAILMTVSKILLRETPFGSVQSWCGFLILQILIWWRSAAPEEVQHGNPQHQWD